METSPRQMPSLNPLIRNLSTPFVGIKEPLERYFYNIFGHAVTFFFFIFLTPKHGQFVYRCHMHQDVLVKYFGNITH